VSQPQTLILVGGAPGTGKSTLAPLLARRYACTLLAKDTIKEALFETLGTADSAWSRRLSDASFASMFGLARQGLASGANLLLEGNFRAGEHEPAIKDLLACGVSSVRCVQVLCTVPEPLRRERLMARAHSGARHAGHRDAAQMLPAVCDFLDVPAARFGYQATESSKAAEERLLAAIDAHLQQP